MRKIISYLSFVIPAIIMIAAISSNEKFDITRSGQYRIDGERITFFDNTKNTLTAKDVSELEFANLPAGSDDPNFGFSDHDIWLKFELDPAQISTQADILQVNNPLLDAVELYEITDKGPILMAGTGDRVSFHERPVKHRLYRFPIKVDAIQNKQYLLRLNSGGEQCLAPVSLWTKDALASKDSRDNLIRGVYFGLVSFVLLFTLFLYLRLRETSSLYYIQYNANLMLLQAALSGYTFQFIWPNNPYLANVSTPLFASLSILSLLKFAQHFLEIKAHFPRINRIFHVVGYAVACNVILSLIPDQRAFKTSVLAINIIALLLNLAIIPVAYGVLKKGYKPAKFFLIGFIALVFTVFGFIGTNLGLIKNEFYAEYGLLIGSALEVILLSFAVVDRFRSFKEQAIDSLRELNKMEREQNEVLERTVDERTREINIQKSEIELKNEEILSSIRYAEKIQRNLLPSENEIQKVFPESFVFYQPKDIVSGDFYWVGRSRWNGVASPAHEISLIAAGDCTGHGVPGAMVSVLGCNLLRESLQQKPEAKPGELLTSIDERLKLTMNAHEGMQTGDGMDMVLCAYQHDTRELWISGANNSVMRWNGNDFEIIKGNSRSIGTRTDHLQFQFETKVILTSPGDMLYITTDGFADQFGGPAQKKLKSSGLKKLLQEIVTLPIGEQKNRVKTFFNAWKGNQEQTDDVCLVGFRIK
jgi:two-component system, sensor histidine kinase LadS